MLERLLAAEGRAALTGAAGVGRRQTRPRPRGRRRRRQDRSRAARHERGAAVTRSRRRKLRPTTSGSTAASSVLEGLLESAIAHAGLGPLERPFAATAQVLLSGVDLPEELSALRAAIEQLQWSERLVVENDTRALLRAGTDRGWGVAVVCGAGINCLGLAPDGARGQVPVARPGYRATGAAARDVGLARSPPPCAPPTDAGRARARERGARALRARRPARGGAGGSSWGDPTARLGELAPVVLAGVRRGCRRRGDRSTGWPTRWSRSPWLRCGASS